MADLAFAPQNNMIAYLEKTKNNNEFHQIVDFLTSSSIHHSLTIHAIVDGKTVVITKLSMRRYLLFTDANGITWLTNEHIFENLLLMRTSTSKRHRLGKRIVSKHGRKNLKSQQNFQDIDDLVDEGMNFVLDEDADTKMIVEDEGNGEKGGSISETFSTARPDISAARPEVSTAKPKTPPTIATLFDDEDVTIANTLVKMKNQKAKKKGIALKDADDSARPIRSITTLQPLPTIDPKDKDAFVLKGSKEDEKRTEVPDDDKATDYETLDVKSLIVDWRLETLMESSEDYEI
nr:hypothetical protein [Tanacetum cinerariifolium]